MKKFTYKIKLIFITISILMTLASCAPSNEANSPANLSVHFIDVGQGDSTLILAPQGEAMLIDAGNNGVGDDVIAYMKNQGVEKLDVLVGTHPDADHIGGLDTVIYEYDIESFYMPRKAHTTKTFKDVLLAAKEKGLNIKEAKIGEKFILGEDVKCEILNPVKEYGDDNNLWSVVVRIEYGKRSLLFMGDAEIENESDMLEYGAYVDSDVIKLGHHGSSTSSSESFIKAVSPDAAVVSCKMENSYGHPHRETLELLEKEGIELYRTDEQGSVVFYCDKNRIWSDMNPGSYEYYGEMK
ncbi:Metal-dependent hydrolase, beta-lactamase superfamily II [Peptoclostridium litorale DSM 5388]|uniref:ComE operon protein 3 n=1 Tax=Peptoclostridium litorale DSM 5388 TaxID=1121324 RepID=A0A069RLH0_PEPLI|nr:MBL fold metallo-hydrolase [Peptoclostridium litorale]KDR95047.1 ComE operon protein 3 [Peptoclostridium litorale DSM 5388]SIN75904.1 Metal-dependent hydrolase, beta-lactamase superfamily II [Peptoclostridium litorale DSM 5388]